MVWVINFILENLYIQQCINTKQQNNTEKKIKILVLTEVESDCEVGGTRQIDNWKFVSIIPALWFTDLELFFTHAAAFGLTFTLGAFSVFTFFALLSTSDVIHTSHQFSCWTSCQQWCCVQYAAWSAACRLQLQLIVLQQWHIENGWYNVPEDLLLRTSASQYIVTHWMRLKPDVTSWFTQGRRHY